MTPEKTYTLDELEAADSEALDAESANAYSLEDLDRLDSWEEPKQGMVSVLSSYGKGFASDLARVPGQVGEILKETGEKGGAGLAIPSFIDGIAITNSFTKGERLKGPADEALIRIGETLSKKNEEWMKRTELKPESEGKADKVAFDLGAGSSSVLTSLGLLYATRSPTLPALLSGARQKADIYKEARAAAKTPEEASAISSAAGLIEGGVEQLGGVAFLKAISFNKWITRAVARAATEGLEEGIQQAGEEAVTNVTGVRKDSMQEIAMRIGYASVIGFTLGVPAGAVSTAIEKTSIKKELRGLGFSKDQTTRIIEKISEKTIEDGSVKMEVEKFIQEEITKTEQILNESLPPAAQSEAEAQTGTATATMEENDIYAQNFKARQQKQGESPQQLYDKISSGISRIAEPVSTRLGQINPKLKNKLRRYEYDLKQRTLEDEKSAKPFLEAYSKLNEKDQSDLDLALKNKDQEKIKDVLERNRMTQEYQGVRHALDALYIRAKDTGLDLGFIEEYFPRKVKDVDGMLKFFQKQDTWPEMVKAMNAKEVKLGRKLNDEEKAEMLNSMLRGFSGGGKAKLARPGNVKERKIDTVTPELNKFYQDSPQALLNYIYRVNDFIEARRFFGKAAKGKEMSENTLDDSIGAFVLDLLQDGSISGAQAKDVSDILKSRFAQKGPGGIVSAVKNITYIETMGSVTSAITQIGDIAFSLYKNGFYRTGKALAETVSGQAQLTKEDIGIERIAEEFAEKSKTAAALDFVFKSVGLNWMDRLGKETQINAALDKYSELAQKPTPEFTEQMKLIFGDEAAQTAEDLKAKTASDNVKFLLFSELADVQPIALSEMPEQYLKGGNSRLFYMLKTYTIKQLDVFRNEVFLKMRKDPKTAIGNFLRLSSLLMLANGTADLLKDLILNRPIEPDDYVIDNLLRLFGVSKFTLYKFKKEGVSQGVSSFVVPPLGKFISSGAKDIDKMLQGEFDPQEAEIIQSVPLLGKMYYWWFGGGKAKSEKGKSGRTRL